MSNNTAPARPGNIPLVKQEQEDIARQYPTHIHVEKFELSRRGAERARCNVLLNGSAVIERVRLMQNNEGHLFVAMPSEATFNGHKPHVRLINPDLREQLQAEIIDIYCQEMELAQREFAQQMSDGMQAPQAAPESSYHPPEPAYDQQMAGM